MRAKFIRHNENPLDSLNIGRIEERKTEKIKIPIQKALEKIRNNFIKCSEIEDHSGKIGTYIDIGFFKSGYWFYIGYDFDEPGGWFTGYKTCEINIMGNLQYEPGEESIEDTLEDCIYRLTEWIKIKNLE